MKLKTLVDKYKSLSAPVKASIWFTVCNIIQKGIALISTPIFHTYNDDTAVWSIYDLSIVVFKY